MPRSVDLYQFEDNLWHQSIFFTRLILEGALCIVWPVRTNAQLYCTIQAKYITEAEEKYNQVLKALDPQLSLHYQRRCVEATKEGNSATVNFLHHVKVDPLFPQSWCFWNLKFLGGNMSGHPLGTWSIPPLILDEEFYRSSLLDTK